ncbi:MAG: phytanoyl-CoA dioxygenase family protein [Pirellulaceae bacterium]
MDYSTFHHPTDSLFPLPDGSSADDRFRLSQDQVDHYHEHGYVAGVQVLNDEQIERLRNELAELTQPDHEGSEYWYEYNSNESSDPSLVLFHALGAWRIRAGFHDMLWNAAFTIPASQLLDGAVRFWHDQLFCKPARHGGVVAWHQDYSYWTRTAPMAHLTCWIGLDDAMADNGCLQYVPGSHRWPLLPITGLAGDMQAIREVLDDQQFEQLMHPTAIELKAGQCAFHHPLMVHGSFENRTDRPRRAAVLNVVRDGVRSMDDQPLLATTDPIAKGQPLGGQFYPMLYEPKK